MANPAEVNYCPPRPTTSQPVSRARASLEAALKSQEGVKGFGVTRDELGGPALAVYVRTSEDLSLLPPSHEGFPVVGLITGEIDALSAD